MFDGKFANLKDLSLANEWVSTSIAKYMSGEDEDLHAMLRRDFASLIPAKTGDIGAIRLDTFQVDALMEVRFPVKYAMFSSESDLIGMWGSDPFNFNLATHMK